MTAITDPLTLALGLAAAFAGTFAAAGVGIRATTAAVNTWYVTLRKPAWVPSGRAIGLVWTILYVLMAIGAWLVWRERGWDAWPWLVLDAVQLGLNALWSILFFGRKDPRAALGEIVVLWTAVLATLAAFWVVTPWAGLLFVPYLAWVTFAANLNRVVVRMNPGTI